MTGLLATLAIAGLTLIPRINVEPFEREDLTDDERLTILAEFSVAYPGETVLSLEGEDLDGMPKVTVTFGDQERTPVSRLLQVVDCYARLEPELDQARDRTVLRVSPDHWDCGESYQVVVLTQEIPPARVSVDVGVPHGVTERLLAFARSRVGRQFVTLTRIEASAGGTYSLHYTMRNGFGITQIDPEEAGLDAR